MSLPLDPKIIRAAFPAFSEPALEGQAFFENAGGSYTCQQVLSKLEHYYRATKVQPYATYPASIAAGEAMVLAYQRIGDAMGVDADWIHFGPSTSANTYTLAHALGEKLSAGDTIIVTNQDHEANTGVFRRLEARGINIREWQINPETVCLELEALDDLLDSTTKVVAFPHSSNIVGHINPVADICSRIKSAGAISIVDGVSAAPHGIPDIRELGADIYLLSAYKTFGPHQGIMAVRPEVAADLPNQGHYFNEDKPHYRLTPAGPDHAQIAACSGIADYLEYVAQSAGVPAENAFHQAHALMRAQETALMAPLIAWLTAAKNACIIGPLDPQTRAANFALKIDEPLETAKAMAKRGIMVGAGMFYANRLLDALGVNPAKGVLRVSFTHYTTPSEITALISALDEFVG